MTAHSRFLYVCDKRFEELEGTGSTSRRCNACSRTVHNVDAMTPPARAELFARVQREQTTICVSALVTPETELSCRGWSPAPLTGMVARDPQPYVRPQPGEPNALVWDCDASVDDLAYAVTSVGTSMGLVPGWGYGVVRDPEARLWHVGGDATRGWPLEVCVSPRGAGSSLGFRMYRSGEHYPSSALGLPPDFLLFFDRTTFLVVCLFVGWVTVIVVSLVKGFIPILWIAIATATALFLAGLQLKERLARRRHRLQMEQNTVLARAYAANLYQAAQRSLEASRSPAERPYR